MYIVLEYCNSSVFSYINVSFAVFSAINVCSSDLGLSAWTSCLLRTEQLVHREGKRGEGGKGCNCSMPTISPTRHIHKYLSSYSVYWAVL